VHKSNGSRPNRQYSNSQTNDGSAHFSNGLKYNFKDDIEKLIRYFALMSHDQGAVYFSLDMKSTQARHHMAWIIKCILQRKW